VTVQRGDELAIMVVGFAGNTGSTLIGTLALLTSGVLRWDQIPSSVTGCIEAPPPRSVCYGGWDFTPDVLGDLVAKKGLIPEPLAARLPPVKITECSPLSTALDYFATTAGQTGRVGAAAEKVAEDVERFRKQSAAIRPIVVYLGTPSKKSRPPVAEVASWAELLSRPYDSVPASLIYAAGAISAGADFVDFTPSEALTCPALWKLADERGVQLVGRDGSTGQTMMKAALAEMLRLRGLAPRSWYSSNHLGNEDGRILSDPEYSWLKLADKKRGIGEILGGDIDHVVSIDYMRSKGDRKESFDSVLAEDIFGGEIRLRLNWEAWDSALATAMLLDIVRLVLVGQVLGLRGVQRQLAFFFKSPVGALCLSPESSHRAMTSFYAGATAR
jgi:myo-inositol-1-phosphate synthase